MHIYTILMHWPIGSYPLISYCFDIDMMQSCFAYMDIFYNYIHMYFDIYIYMTYPYIIAHWQ